MIPYNGAEEVWSGIDNKTLHIRQVSYSNTLLFYLLSNITSYNDVERSELCGWVDFKKGLPTYSSEMMLNRLSFLSNMVPQSGIGPKGN